MISAWEPRGVDLLERSLERMVRVLAIAASTPITLTELERDLGDYRRWFEAPWLPTEQRHAIALQQSNAWGSACRRARAVVFALHHCGATGPMRLLYAEAEAHTRERLRDYRSERARRAA